MSDREYPNVPWAKAGSPETAFEAAESVTEIAKSIRAQVERAIALSGRSGMTGDAVAASLELSPYQVRSRIAELRAAKRVVDSGRRDLLGSGRRGVVWVLAEYGPPEPDSDQLELPVAA